MKKIAVLTVLCVFSFIGIQGAEAKEIGKHQNLSMHQKQEKVFKDYKKEKKDFYQKRGERNDRFHNKKSNFDKNRKFAYGYDKNKKHIGKHRPNHNYHFARYHKNPNRISHMNHRGGYGSYHRHNPHHSFYR